MPDAESSWEGPIERAAAALRGDAFDGAEWRALGRTTAELHQALVDAFGLRAGTPELLARHRAEGEAALAGASARDPEVAALAPPGARRPLPRSTASPRPRSRASTATCTSARSCARAREPPLVIDFEGDPTKPLADRRRPDTPLYDLACVLRCVDHVGSAAARRAGGASPVVDRRRARGDPGAYAQAAPVRVDHDLLAGLELAKECAELVYAQRVAPEWAYAPMASFARMLS